MQHIEIFLFSLSIYMCMNAHIASGTWKQLMIVKPSDHHNSKANLKLKFFSQCLQIKVSQYS